MRYLISKHRYAHVRRTLAAWLEAMSRWLDESARQYEVQAHITCVVCGECMTCNLRPCFDGGEHTAP